MRMAQLVAVVFCAPFKATHDFACAGVQKKFVVVEAVAPLRLKRPVGAQTIHLARTAPGHEAVKHAVIGPVQRQAL